MPRISVVEQYDNKDLIQQIYRLKDLVETGTASNIAITDNHDGTITVDVTMRDGNIQTFTLANDNIATIAAVQNGADVTVTVTFESGNTQSFTFNVASGKVDVLTTTGDYVYSHSGATQGEIPVTNFVDVSGAQAITGAKTVPLEATGTFSDQIASSNKVKNELDNYAPMVRTTGNQNIAGQKVFTIEPLGALLNHRDTTPDYCYFMKLKLRTDSDNSQVFAMLNRSQFYVFQLTEVGSGLTFTVTDHIGNASSIFYFALYTDGTDYYLALKKRTNDASAYNIRFIAGTCGAYALALGTYSMPTYLTSVDGGWTQIHNTE